MVGAASVAEASLVPGGASVSVTLRGDGLASLTDAFVASRGRPVGDTKAALARTRSRTSRSLELAGGRLAVDRPGAVPGEEDRAAIRTG